MRFGNLNIREEAIKRIGALALAGSMTFTMCGCGGKEMSKPSQQALAKYSIGETLDAVSDLTTMDELLKEDKFVNRSDEKEYTFEELLNAYEKAKDEQNLSDCNILLYKIGRMIMKAQLAEALCIKPEQIVSLNINVKAGYISTLDITYKTYKDKTLMFFLNGEMEDLAINISRACNHALDFIEVDEVYESFIEHLLTTTSITRTESFGFLNMFRGRYDISAYLSQEKVDAFNSYDDETIESNNARKKYR